jgi:hypothetical protein
MMLYSSLLALRTSFDDILVSCYRHVLYLNGALLKNAEIDCFIFSVNFLMAFLPMDSSQ